MARQKTETGQEILTNCASVGIIYRTSDPSQIFLEVKDPGYPRKVFVGMGCLIGGNWAGEKARGCIDSLDEFLLAISTGAPGSEGPMGCDWGPSGTLLREVYEELSFKNAEVNLEELEQLHGISTINLGQSRGKTPLPQDERDLQYLIAQIEKNVVPYRAHIVTVPEIVFQRGEPNYSRGDVETLVSYYTIGLSEDAWKVLERLQRDFGNLSNESITVITSLEKIVETGFQISWGHDQALRRFFLDNGLALARKMRMVPDISTIHIGTPANSYKSYTERYRFKITPFGSWCEICQNYHREKCSRKSSN